MWEIRFTKTAEKDKKKLKNSNLENKTKKLLNVMAVNPYENPPHYEKLLGNLDGYISRRINRQHRIVYKVYENKGLIVIHSMWTHYEG